MLEGMNWPLVVFVIFWLVGLVGTFVPVLPAVWIILAGALLAGLMEGFSALSWPWLALVGLLALASVLVDNLASAWGARKYGGSRAAMWGALIGGLAGLFVFPPWGMLAGPLVGSLAGEVLVMRRSLRAGLASSWGTFLGMLAGLGAKLVLHVAMGALVIWRLA